MSFSLARHERKLRRNYKTDDYSWSALCKTSKYNEYRLARKREELNLNINSVYRTLIDVWWMEVVIVPKSVPGNAKLVKCRILPSDFVPNAEVAALIGTARRVKILKLHLVE